MASTRNLQASAAFSLPLINQQPINIGGNEPGLTAANIVKQTMLGPPFDWAWNRTERQVQLSTGVQDYLVAAPRFGFLSRVTVFDASGNAKEVEVKTSLSRESARQRPQSAAVQANDGQGNILLRFNTLPDQNYMATMMYQYAVQPMTSMANLWAPIPDELSYIYDWLYLGVLSLLVKDSRMTTFRQMGISNLLAAQDGLDATKRNLFLGNWLDVVAAQERSQLRVQQGNSARAV